MQPLTIALGNYGLTKPIKQAGIDFGRLSLRFVEVEQIVPMMRRMLTVDQGAATSLYCATSPDVAQDSGKFYDKCAERAPSQVATPELAAELWKRSEEWAAAS